MFRTQGKDFGFPYPQSGNQIARTRQMTRDMFFNNTYKHQIYPFSWLLEKFKPIPDWHDKKNKKLLSKINVKGGMYLIPSPKMPIPTGPTKGIIYYTRNKVNIKIGHQARKYIKKAGLPVVSVSTKKMDFGTNFQLSTDGSFLEYFKKILIGLELIDTDIVFFCEDDVLYHSSHFDFTPPKKDVYYYNDNWWRLRTSDGHAVTYDTHVAATLCGYRKLLLDHYRKVVDKLVKEGYSNKLALKIGFEPGTHNRKERVDDYKAEGFRSKHPCIDIRHGNNITKSRWKQSEFRSQRSCQGWKETKNIPGWDKKELHFGSNT